ncbi:MULTISPECIES: LysR substrate-binding domain-containing protein [unclassified Massilia]|uniref:LysR substrate-binding domain-containing protein n=1 Tax=unclassified Massilia TaxID=2609279 RepID=UPI00177DCE57|nr:MULTISPECIES: LysR substrate-binding domain-containing protein [unclassified Massilia]MBD8530700.1 LysR family transcriptional regulator [Massilia sp. CFBP 13647]MBD8674925.1 LysR family transcriptional regulator [Massilia sp. CFBP 13721]
MTNLLDNDDLRVFVTVVRKSSFAGAAEALGMSPAYVSKRIGILEEMLGVRLFQRTTRRVVITSDGEQVYVRAQAILDNLDELMDEVSERRREPSGQVRICSSFGFGRNLVAPAIAKLVAAYPGLQIRFEVFDRLVDTVAEGFDLNVRVGDEIAPHLIARRLLANHRILCAAPAYLARHPAPKNLADLAGHQCLPIKERDHPFGVWRLRGRSGVEETVKVSGALSTNHGEIALRWALDGAGIVLRSRWDAQPYLDAGTLVQVLPEYTQEANVWAVYPQRLAGSAKVRVCVEFLERHLGMGEAT